MLRSIVVATDLSERSRRPFPAVAALARRWNVPLNVLHVCAHPDICMPWQVTPSAHEDVEAKGAVRSHLCDAMASDSAFSGVDVRVHVLAGQPEEEICAFVDRERSALLAMTTHGRTDIDDCLLGSLARRILHSVPCPVLVFPTNGGSPPPQSELPGRILAPFDFSAPSRVGLTRAFELARLLGTRLRLLFVVEEIGRAHKLLLGASDSVANYFEAVRKEAARRLERIIAEEGGGVEVDAVAHIGDPTSKIIEEARTYGADWIVISSRGESSPHESRIGSVAERTLLGARLPVLVIRPTESLETLQTAQHGAVPKPR